MPIISAFPTGESTVDYTGPKSSLPSLEEGKIGYVTDEKRLYTGNADGENTQVPNADDVKTEVSEAVSEHNSADDAHADKFAKYLPLAGGEVGPIKLVPGGVYTTGRIGSQNGKARILVSDDALSFQLTTSDNHPRFDLSAEGFHVEHLKRPYGGLGVYPDEVSLICGNNSNVSVKDTGVRITNVVTPTTDTMPTPKSYVDNAIGGLTPSACKVTLSASGWDSSAKTQSATVSGVLEDESKQLIMPMPAGTSMSAYNEAGIQMTGQSTDTVTFTADTVPSADIEIWVVVQTVNDVTPLNVVFSLGESPSASAAFTCNYTSAEVLSYLEAGKPVTARLDYDVLGNITPCIMTMTWSKSSAVVRFKCIVEGKTCTFRGMREESDWVLESVN